MKNDDPQIGQDLLNALDKLIPEGVWLHDTVDENGASHLKATIFGAKRNHPYPAWPSWARNLASHYAG